MTTDLRFWLGLHEDVDKSLNLLKRWWKILVQRVNRGRARFERGHSSLGLNLQDSLDRTTSPGTELGQRGNVISATQQFSGPN